MDGELRGISSPEGGYDRSSPLADVPGTGDDPGGKASRLAAWERLASPPPAFPEHAARQILWERFGKTGSVAPLGGERDQNFRVETPGGQRFLLKISHPADRLPTLQMQAAALRHIEAVDPGLPVMRVVPTVAGEPWAEVAGPDGRAHPVRLFTFLPGRLIEPATEQQQAAEGQRVGVEDPGQAGRGKAQAMADLWERNVHDGQVQDDHELGAEHQGQADPAGAGPGWGREGGCYCRAGCGGGGHGVPSWWAGLMPAGGATGWVPPAGPLATAVRASYPESGEFLR
jgi:hypothetical protein